MMRLGPVLRDEFLDAGGGVVVDTGEHIVEVCLGIDFGQATVFHEGKHDGGAWTRVFMADEEPVFSSEFERPQGVLSEVVVDAGGGVVEAFPQAFFMTEQVIDGLGHGRLQKHFLGGVFAGPAEDLIDVRPAVPFPQHPELLRRQAEVAGQPFDAEEPVDVVQKGIGLAFTSLGGADEVAPRVRPGRGKWGGQMGSIRYLCVKTFICPVHLLAFASKKFRCIPGDGGFGPHCKVLG